MAIAFKDVLIGAILIAGMTGISCLIVWLICWWDEREDKIFFRQELAKQNESFLQAINYQIDLIQKTLYPSEEQERGN
jgi:hypothetical protein